MKHILIIKIYSDDNLNGLNFSKTYESDFSPIIGYLVNDPIFAEAKKIIEVEYNYMNNEVIVKLESKKVKNEALDSHIQEVANLHSWVLEK